MKTEITVDRCNYFAKATMPPGNSWRSPMMEKEAAEAKARWFVREWLQNGICAEACVFYRDGSIHATFNRHNCW